MMEHRILLAVDGTESCLPAVRKAISMAAETDRRVTAMYVKEIGFRMRPSYYSPREIDRMARDVFSSVRSMADEAGVDIEFKVAVGHAARDIASMSRGYDFVVCGTNSRRGLIRMVAGSVSDSLARLCKCATMIVQSRARSMGESLSSDRAIHPHGHDERVRSDR